MKSKSNSYKSAAVSILLIILMFGNLQLPARTQEPPLNLNQILNVLQSKKDKLSYAQKNEVLIKIVKERGISFRLINPIAFQLLTFGATKEFINALKDTQKEIQKPKPIVEPEAKIIPPTANSSATKTNNFIINVSNPTDTNLDERFDREIDEGNRLRDERNYYNSESAYRRAFRLNPKDLRAAYGLGNIFGDQQRWEEAEKSYRQALQIDPKDIQTNIALIFVLTQPVEEKNVYERYAEAERLARRVIQLDANNAIAYLQLGAVLQLQGQAGKETQNAFERAIQIDPNFGLTYAYLGNLLKRNGMNDESNAAYRDAVRLATDVPTMILVADVMESQQHNIQSEQLLRNALQSDPKNLTALLLLGKILAKGGQFNEAEKLLKKSIEIGPGNYVPYLLLTSLYTSGGKFEEIEQILNVANQTVSLNDKKRIAKGYEILGDNFMRIGKRKDAARVYRQSILLTNEKNDLNDKLINAEGIK